MLKSSALSLVACVPVESKGEPLEHQTCFHVSFIRNGRVCTTPGIWSLPLLTAHGGSFHIHPLPPLSTHWGCSRTPNHTAPSREAKGGLTEAPRVGRGIIRNDAERRVELFLLALWAAQMKFESGVAVITKHMTQCWSVFRCLALHLQMAHSRRSHQPLLHPSTFLSPPPHFQNTHTQTHTKTLTTLSGEPIWEWKEASLEMIPSLGDYINRLHGGRRRKKRRGRVWALSPSLILDVVYSYP